MIGVISEDENHNKIFKPMAGATLGQGVPLGTWCSFEKDVAPSSNWLMAGTTFDASVYPALNLYLGTNVVPSRYDHNRPSDYEDFSYTNNTDITMEYDGLLFLSETGQDPTIYVNGEKIGKMTWTNYSNVASISTISVKKGDVVKITATIAVHHAIWYKHPLFIKATSIASDTDQQSILAQIQAYNTYSTEETLTGKTWIDGKPIYKKTIEHIPIASTTNVWQGTSKVIQDIETLVMVENVIGEDNGRVNVPILFKYGMNNLQYFQNSSFEGNYTVTCFYTKTTD